MIGKRKGSRKAAEVETQGIDKLEVEDIRLIFLIDRSKDNLESYLQVLGIDVSEVYTQVEQAQDAIQLNVLTGIKQRIVVVDTGSGAFTGTLSQKALLDFLGSANEDMRVSLYYTRNSLKYDIKLKVDVGVRKYIDLKSYKGFSGIARDLLARVGERYVV